MEPSSDSPLPCGGEVTLRVRSGSRNVPSRCFAATGTMRTPSFAAMYLCLGYDMTFGNVQRLARLAG